MTQPQSYSPVVHVAGVWHLLRVHAKGRGLRGLGFYNAVVHHVLQVGEASPYIAEVVVRAVVGSGNPQPC